MTLLDRGTIERALTLSGDAPLLIALSGGGDSTALLHLLTEELGGARLRACVVDHGLRAESAEEAQRAAGFAEKLGVAAQVGTLTWPKPGPRAHLALRYVRYKALCAAARQLGARVILLAHTRDDQAETVLMRAGAGSGWRGLAGISAFASAPLWPEGRGLFVARPLLRARREALRAVLRERAAAWIEDPSNDNIAFARVRARQRLAALEAEGLDPMRFAGLAETLAPRVAMLDGEAGRLIEAAVSFDGPLARIDLGAWRGEDETRRRALAVLIAIVSGEDRLGAPEGLEEAEAKLVRNDFAGLTLGGAWLRPVRGGVVLERDKGAVLGRAGGKAKLAPVGLVVSEEAVWDGRLALTAREPGWSVEVDEAARPVLVKYGERLPLDATDRMVSRWLLSEHLAHRLAIDRQ